MHETEVLLYARETDAAGERLQHLIETRIPGKKIGLCRSMKALSHRLNGSGVNNTIVILIASGEEDFEKILDSCDLLADIRIIIILPDAREETIAKGHRLYPRFLSYRDGDFEDVVTVLENMLSKTKITSFGGNGIVN
jgi:hypothetical protein